MAKPTFSEYLRFNLDDVNKKKDCGPFVTMSFEFGCNGSEIGQMLVGRINDRIDPITGGDKWTLNEEGFLRQFAADTGVDEDFIKKERLTRPSFFKDLLRTFQRKNIPDSYEIFNGLAVLIRHAAYAGRCVILGQGSTAATADLDNGLHIRLKGSREWKIARLTCREDLNRQQAIVRLDQITKQHRFIRSMYRQRNPRQPAFHLVIDNSIFSDEQVVNLILTALEEQKMIPRV